MNPIRHVPAHEYWPCFVGSGECHTPAEFVIDNGKGGDAYICPAHWEEFQQMEAWLDGNPDRYKKLADAIKAVE